MGAKNWEDLAEKLGCSPEDAAAEVFRRYSQRLLALAESRLNPRVKARVGADDIVQSVFRTFFRRSADGQFTFDHTGALWRLLVTITIRKAMAQGRPSRHGPPTIPLDVDEGADLAGEEPSPPEVATVIDLTQRMLEKLNSRQRRMVELRFQGYSTPQIGKESDCSRTTVWRVLDRVEEILQRML